MQSACKVSSAHLANPPLPLGSAVSSGLATTDLALATVTHEETDFGCHTDCTFAFYGNNAVVALASAKLQNR